MQVLSPFPSLLPWDILLASTPLQTALIRPRPSNHSKKETPMSPARRTLTLALLMFATAAGAWAQTPTYHAFLWSSASGMQDLGSLGTSSYANAINDAGRWSATTRPAAATFAPFAG